MLAMMLSGLTVLFVDVLLKEAVESLIARRPARPGNSPSIRPVVNRRRAYSRLPVRVLLVLLWSAALAAALILVAIGSLNDLSGRIAIGAALGGAAGNLIDILRSHAVRDYIDLGWWPVFNLADIAIIGGLALAFLRRNG